MSRQQKDSFRPIDSSSPGERRHRQSFTRSRSPRPPPSMNNGDIHRTSSPLRSFRNRHTTERYFLPTTIDISFHMPYCGAYSIVSIDARKAGECSLLISSLVYVTEKLSSYEQRFSAVDIRISIELQLLIIASLIYLLWSHLSFEKPPSNSPLSQSASLYSQALLSPRPLEPRDSKRLATITKKEHFGFVWMTVPKNYRESSDDGILSAVLLGPLVASAMLYCSLRISEYPNLNIGLLSTWLVEPPLALENVAYPHTAQEALLVSRLNLVDLATLCSIILLVHVCASWWTEYRCTNGISGPEGERRSVPRSEARKWWLYVLFTSCVTLAMLIARALLADAGSVVWEHLNYFDVAVSSLFYQSAMYVSIRLAHRSFTLGELGLVSLGATALFMEMVNVTIARIWPVTTPFIKSFRLPGPLLIYQIAMIPGSLLTGFLLCPLLVLSRHIAQQSVRRLRLRQERLAHRRSLALGFYLGAALVVGGLIGMWTRWCLANRDPWLWVVFWCLQGKRKWSRPVLLAYWALLGSLSVAGWNRQLARSRRYRAMNPSTGTAESFVVSSAPEPPVPADPVPPPSPNSAGGSLGLSFSNLPNLPNGANMSNAATEFLDAANKRVPTLSLNARRKFFHILAIAMFLPGLAYDPAFAHLAFGAAFALFTFAEYVRYFALYPFGAAVHLFMNEFLDQKDCGTAILSHFYLLTGCAGSVWLEGPTRLLLFTGILTLGVGDAVASIVGKRIGKHRWSATTSKTLEGSAGFTVSIVLCAWLLQLFGVTEAFPIVRYTVVAALASALEALSVQNDNLTLPLYMWSMLVVADV